MISLLIIGTVFFTSCGKSKPDNEPQNKSFFAMDTYMTITAYGENAESALNKAEERVSELENLWSVTKENSEIYAINHSNGQSEYHKMLRFHSDLHYSLVPGNVYD